MKICVIGSDRLGLVAATCFAERGSNVVYIDVSEEIIQGLDNGLISIEESRLKEMMIRNGIEGRLSFATNLAQAVEESLIIFIIIGISTDNDGSVDSKRVLDIARNIGGLLKSYKVIVNKSTVPLGTAEKMRLAIAEELDRRGESIEFDIVSKPGFLAEGFTIDDFMKPQRVVIGVEDVRTVELMKVVYEPFIEKCPHVIITDVKNAEMMV